MNIRRSAASCNEQYPRKRCVPNSDADTSAAHRVSISRLAIFRCVARNPKTRTEQLALSDLFNRP